MSNSNTGKIQFKCVHLTSTGTLVVIIFFVCVSSSESAYVKPSMYLALPPSLYRWAAPEVIKQQPCTKKTDIYSLCALIQELYTGSPHKHCISRYMFYPFLLFRGLHSQCCNSVLLVTYYVLFFAFTNGLRPEPGNKDEYINKRQGSTDISNIHCL